MSAPVKNTCPDIDSVISRVLKALKLANEGIREHEKRSDDWYRYDEIDTHLSGIDGDLEDLRNANASLREWGEDLDSQLQSAGEEIAKLEEKAQELISKQVV
jgi:chromosome segregation ATPase